MTPLLVNFDPLLKLVIVDYLFLSVKQNKKNKTQKQNETEQNKTK